jgi:hypothetical protein
LEGSYRHADGSAMSPLKSPKTGRIIYRSAPNATSGDVQLLSSQIIAIFSTISVGNSVDGAAAVRCAKRKFP